MKQLEEKQAQVNQTGLLVINSFNRKYLEEEVVLKSSYEGPFFCTYFLNNKPILRQKYTQSI